MDLLFLLRQSTRAHHARLNASLDFRHPSITRQRYAAFLSGLEAVVGPLERALTAWFGAAPGPSRLDCLRADLACLGASRSVEPLPMRLPVSLAEAYGCAYVLEGSALGGVVLARTVTEVLGPGAATSYLALRGIETGNAWSAFLRRLRVFGAAATAAEANAACGGACATFDAYTISLIRAGAFDESCACTTP